MDTVDLGSYDVRRGDAFVLPILGELDDNDAVVNLASYGPTWTAQLRTSPDAATGVAFTVDTSNIDGQVDADRDAWQLVLRLSGEQTGQMAVRQWVFDVQVAGGSISPLTLYSGRLNIRSDVTRA